VPVGRIEVHAQPNVYPPSEVPARISGEEIFMTMRNAVAVFTLLAAVTALPTRAEKIKGTTTLKDVQTAGVKGDDHKHQAYDLLFDTQNKSYTCRTNSDKSMNATEFVVGSQIKYEIDSDKGKIQSMENKKVECKIVRVELAH